MKIRDLTVLYTALVILGSLSVCSASASGGAGIDETTYFTPQSSFELEAFPFTMLAGNAPTFTETDDPSVPFSKVALSTSHTQFASDFIPVQAGETLYGEIWAMRQAGTSGANGTVYYGIARYDKDKKPIAGNLALDYFVAVDVSPAQNGAWTKYSGQRTLPKTHAPYSGSDGGAVRYVKAYIIINYSSGTIPTYWGGIILRRVVQQRDNGTTAFLGNVGIGTINPTHKLAVNGTIKAKEVIVETTGWSDYVFADDYTLAPLSEVEAHIKTNKHLPGIPSAAQVSEQGISVGDMQAKLLAKIEELTLHQIAQEKRIAALEAENKRLRSQPK